MSQSQFDPALFLDAQVNEVNTRRPPLPATNPASTDGFYTAVVGEVKTDTGTIEKGDRAGQPRLAMIERSESEPISIPTSGLFSMEVVYRIFKYLKTWTFCGNLLAVPYILLAQEGPMR